jgi:hypothetical protein
MKQFGVTSADQGGGKAADLQYCSASLADVVKVVEGIELAPYYPRIG